MPWVVEPVSTTMKTSGSGCHDSDETLVAATKNKKVEQLDCRPKMSHTTWNTVQSEMLWVVEAVHPALLQTGNRDASVTQAAAEDRTCGGMKSMFRPELPTNRW